MPSHTTHICALTILSSHCPDTLLTHILRHHSQCPLIYCSCIYTHAYCSHMHSDAYCFHTHSVHTNTIHTHSLTYCSHTWRYILFAQHPDTYTFIYIPSHTFLTPSHTVHIALDTHTFTTPSLSVHTHPRSPMPFVCICSRSLTIMLTAKLQSTAQIPTVTGGHPATSWSLSLTVGKVPGRQCDSMTGSGRLSGTHSYHIVEPGLSADTDMPWVT